MGFRFRRSIKVAPGVRLNFSKSGVSTSMGVRGAHVTLGHGKVRETIGIPGTGISYTEVHGTQPARDEPVAGEASVRGWVTLLVLMAMVFALAYACGTLIR